MPNVTEREVLCIHDALMEHQTVTERLGLYVNQCEDAEVKQLVQAQHTRMQEHYNQLLGLVRGGGPAGGGHVM